MTEPLRIGILGTARIARDAIVIPARPAGPPWTWAATCPTRASEEVLGDRTSCTYQLARVAETLRDGVPFPGGIDGSVANAELIDECYRRAGLAPRAQTAHPGSTG